MNAYKVEHKAEYKDNGLDNCETIIDLQTKYYTEYSAAIEYAKKYGCTRFYGNIENGMVVCVSVWGKDPYYGDNQTQITITKFELE